MYKGSFEVAIKSLVDAHNCVDRSLSCIIPVVETLSREYLMRC